MGVDWHGYPQAADAHPLLPWWQGPPWTRTDGTLADPAIRDLPWDAPGVTGALQAADTADPLPVPAALGGQVWLWVDGDYIIHRVMVERVQHPTAERYLLGSVALTVWPPAGGLLVAGPGAPWAEVEPL